ncbi:hypothetical protein LV779_09000 [Streptomyces thinghirensis]|nr:hypothetical protein [Streptomyces thinghirensis]
MTDGAGAVRGRPHPVCRRVPPGSATELDAALGHSDGLRTISDPALPPHVAFGGNDRLVLSAARRLRPLADLDYDFDGLAEVMRRLTGRRWT